MATNKMEKLSVIMNIDVAAFETVYFVKYNTFSVTLGSLLTLLTSSYINYDIQKKLFYE